MRSMYPFLRLVADNDEGGGGESVDFVVYNINIVCVENVPAQSNYGHIRNAASHGTDRRCGVLGIT